jgi:hypothetical protein
MLHWLDGNGLLIVYDCRNSAAAEGSPLRSEDSLLAVYRHPGDSGLSTLHLIDDIFLIEGATCASEEFPFGRGRPPKRLESRQRGRGQGSWRSRLTLPIGFRKPQEAFRAVWPARRARPRSRCASCRQRRDSRRKPFFESSTPASMSVRHTSFAGGRSSHPAEERGQGSRRSTRLLRSRLPEAAENFPACGPSGREPYRLRQSDSHIRTYANF